jgi:cephalosporin-C deacetylase-like acetyl esterase
MKILVLTLLLAVSALAQDPDLLLHFDYDQKAPLDLQEVGGEHRPHIAIHDISYVSPKGGRVPAYLVVPEGKGPFAAVLWGHWYQEGSELRNRKEFLDEAIALAPSGVVSLLIDSPIARTGYQQPKDPLDEIQIDYRVQTILDMRRGADLLLARADVDSHRLAYVGHSYNAATGGFLSGIDKRFRCFVLMAGNLSDQVDLKSNELQDFRQHIGPERFDAFMKRYSWLDQGRYVSHAAPATVLLQYATQEDFLSPSRTREYAAIVSEPKQYKLYDAKHALNAEALRDRIAFLAEQLHFTPPAPAVLARIPALVQPPEPKR